MPLCNLGLLLAAIGCAAALAGSAAPARRPHRTATNILPSAALSPATSHPESNKIRAFLTTQAACRDFRPTGLSGNDYLRIINGEVAVFRRCQATNGAIIDPVAQIEWQYSTPCYALSVALLHATGYNSDPELLESGLKAMDASVDEMHEYRCAHNHGEFFLQPVMLALDLYAPFVSPEKLRAWRDKIAPIDPYKLHPDNLQRRKKVYNHNVVALAGEYLRNKAGLAAPGDFFGRHLTVQKEFLTDRGMYKDPNVPMVYDEFSRQFLASIIAEGYDGPEAAFYRDRLWKGAWMSLFMQSPFGECPAGGRSAHHIWNEAQMAVTYEVYAAQYARHEESPQALAAAGAFKRAAHLSLRCIEQWLRPDGSGFVVKNRYPIEAKHGYERYSAQSQYNLLACWLMAVAWIYADESPAEAPSPADLGGFVLPLVEDFHKVFANAGGSYLEYETAGDLHYNPTGLIRLHLKNSNPQLGPSDGVVHRFDPLTKADLGGQNLCTGPAWQDSAGKWHRLADFSPEQAPKVEVLKETPNEVSFKLTYEGEFEGATRIAETIVLRPGGVTIHTVVDGPERLRVYYPMLVFDGMEETHVSVRDNSARLKFRGKALQFTIDQPAHSKLQRTGNRLDFRSGQAEAVFAEIRGNSAVCSIASQ